MRNTKMQTHSKAHSGRHGSGVRPSDIPWCARFWSEMSTVQMMSYSIWNARLFILLGSVSVEDNLEFCLLR